MTAAAAPAPVPHTLSPPLYPVVDTPNHAIEAIRDSTYTVVRPLPPNGLLLRTEDGVLWQVFAHLSPGLP